ncbi:hypothetical protein E2C01_013627 [Portunus trituberculatus]|uniref:Uncharacterized protein n=1 Tax=Portunus trituberculatus TaxID=210409 RepID=A0A5B7DHP9_PORTR|nr:hypothetical protein [Portunus trituberculatus]
MKGRGDEGQNEVNNNDEGGGEDSARTLKGKMVNRFVVTELRQKRKLMGHLGTPGREEIYCDKDRAAAVAMGDQDIKTSLKVKCDSLRLTLTCDQTLLNYD